MNDVTPRHTSRSVVSDQPCFDEQAMFVDGPRARQPSRVGQPLLEAERAVVVLSDGTITNFTILHDERAELEAGLYHAWKRVLAANRVELTEKYNTVHLKFWQIDRYEQDFIRLAGLVPLGILCYEKWTDL